MHGLVFFPWVHPRFPCIRCGAMGASALFVRHWLGQPGLLLFLSAQEIEQEALTVLVLHGMPKTPSCARGEDKAVQSLVLALNMVVFITKHQLGGFCNDHFTTMFLPLTSLSLSKVLFPWPFQTCVPCRLSHA